MEYPAVLERLRFVGALIELPPSLGEGLALEETVVVGQKLRQVLPCGWRDGGTKNHFQGTKDKWKNVGGRRSPNLLDSNPLFLLSP